MTAATDEAMAGQFLPRDMRVLIQGMTGRMGRHHTKLMRAYGTNIVAGVAPKSSDRECDGIAVFRNCVDAVAASGAVASVAMVPPTETLTAILDAVEGGIKLIVTVAEGMPVADAVRALHAVNAAGARWIGPSTPGLAVPGRYKLGFLPDVSMAPGPLLVMSKSGTLSYEVCHRLVKVGIGQSAWVGVGGDAVKGTRFADLVPYSLADEETRAIVVIGEIGGGDEEELAAELISTGCQKPVYALIAGGTARDGVTMGHAGAIVHGNVGTFGSKRDALTSAGARVFERIQDLVDAVTGQLANNTGEI